MKILFVGEYSGVYTELIKALKERDIYTYMVSDGDSFKQFNTDFLLKRNCNITNNVLIILYRHILTALGIIGLVTFMKKWSKLKKVSRGFDIVQLVNPNALQGFGFFVNMFYIHYLYNHNERIYLSVLGDDYYTFKYLKSISWNLYTNLTYREKIYLFFKYSRICKYLNDYAIKISSKIIPGLYIYERSYHLFSKTISFIPFPINKSFIGSPIKIDTSSPIVIFHGWQLGKEKRKGNDIFDKVIKRIVCNYGTKVKYIVVQNVPYSRYIEMFNSCHIFIDQLYAYDKGFNGLLGMAAGKVVFSGFDEESLKGYPYYNNNIIGIKSFNDESYLYDKFSNLIENPNLIEEISKNAIDFVYQNHLNTYVASKYVDVWQS